MRRDIDLNVLVALDALLDEQSVSAAADRLGLSAPAMSRTLSRIRAAFGDPILVRSGRAMVPTPRALALHDEVKAVLERSRALFETGRTIDPADLDQRFTVVATDLMATILAARLLPDLRAQAPGVTLILLPESHHQDDHLLRDGTVDLDIRVMTDPAPETRVEPLLTDDMVAVVRRGHPLADRPLTPAALASGQHIVVSRRGRTRGPIDDALEARGLRRRVVATMPAFSAVLHTVAGSDLVGQTLARVGAPMIEALDLIALPIPLDVPPVTVSMGWHPRFDNDPAQRWFRDRVRAAFDQEP